MQGAAKIRVFNPFCAMFCAFKLLFLKQQTFFYMFRTNFILVCAVVHALLFPTVKYMIHKHIYRHKWQLQLQRRCATQTERANSL